MRPTNTSPFDVAHGEGLAAVVRRVAVLALCSAPAAAAARSSGSPLPNSVSGGPTGHYVVPAGIHKIKHVIVIEQENRSFDSYFGTYPGADGIPMKNGVPTVCVPKPAGGCQQPYHDTATSTAAVPTASANARLDVNGGKMDGFIAAGDQGQEGLPRHDRPGLLQLGHPRRDGLPHGGGDPELLDLRQGLRRSTTTCSSR